MANDFNRQHSLGKGEVDSSILSSSTTKAHEIRASVDAPEVPIGNSARNEAGNAQLDPWKIRGLCSPAVPGEVAARAALLIAHMARASR